VNARKLCFWLSLLIAISPAGRVAAQTVLLDDFNSGTATGTAVPGSTWAGNVTQNAGTITVGGSALDENGWYAPAVNIDATGMNYVTITGQREADNKAPSLALQFEDPNLNTAVFSVATTQFAVGQLTVVRIPILSWSAGFDFTQITAWDLGGGSPGTLLFNMTFDEILLESSVLAAPAITSMATTKTVTEGASVSFTVIATGTRPLSYQWFKDGVAPVSSNATATTETLTFSAVVPGDAGDYTCKVTNSVGNATSPTFTLVVKPLAVVTLSGLSATYTGSALHAIAVTTPSGLTVDLTYDGSATAPVNAGSYAVVATVNDSSYLGSVSGTLVVAKRSPTVTWNAGGPLESGATLTSANLNATANTAGSFEFDPPAGTVLASREHTLTALFTPSDTVNNLSVTTTRLLAVGIDPPTVQTAPANQTTIRGQAVSFAVIATGAGTLNYEWSKGGEVLPDATAATLPLSNLILADAGEYSVRVYSAAGSAPDRSAQLVVFDVEATHDAAGGGYVASRNLTITNTLTYAGTLSLSQLTWSVLPPAEVEGTKWVFVSSSGDDTATKPTAGEVDLFDWQWATVPPSPLTFTYQISVPSATTGTPTLASMINLTIDGIAIDALVRPDPLNIEAGATLHSADLDQNLQLNLSELLRVIELYNTRFGTSRTGRYQADQGSSDGFAPDATSGSGEPTTLTQFHSADSDRNGLLSLSELLRVIELYNFREGTTRTGRYYVSPGSVDGFAPGLSD
jgi:hypothetical protein